jgi:hypothetical protein
VGYRVPTKRDDAGPRFAALWHSEVEPLLSRDVQRVLEAKWVLDVPTRYPKQFQAGQSDAAAALFATGVRGPRPTRSPRSPPFAVPVHSKRLWDAPCDTALNRGGDHQTNNGSLHHRDDPNAGNVHPWLSLLLERLLDGGLAEPAN